MDGLYFHKSGNFAQLFFLPSFEFTSDFANDYVELGINRISYLLSLQAVYSRWIFYTTWFCLRYSLRFVGTLNGSGNSGIEGRIENNNFFHLSSDIFITQSYAYLYKIKATLSIVPFIVRCLSFFFAVTQYIFYIYRDLCS